MTPACSSISLFPSAQTKNTRDDPTAAFPKDSILSRMGKPSIQPTISFVISLIPAWAGKLDAAHRQLGGDGSIPAHAGNTPRAPSTAGDSADHPYLHREHTSNAIGIVRSAGSSLLTRGTRVHERWDRRKLRIIPAHAGNTPSDLCKHLTAQADYGSTVERLPLSYSSYRTPTTKEAQLESLARHRYERPQARQTSNQ